VEFDYYSTYGEKTRRRIEPIRLYFKTRYWYVSGYCLTRNDMRLFKLTRIKDLSVTDERFAERGLPEYNADDSKEERNNIAVTLKMKIAPEMAFRIFDEFDDENLEKHPDGSFTVTVTWPEDDWVYGMILSYGEYIEVLEPEHIREIIKNKTLTTARKYM